MEKLKVRFIAGSVMGTCCAIFCLLFHFAQPLCAQNKSVETKTVKVESEAATKFALELFLSEFSQSNENVIVSPLSAFMALSMTANGARGETLSQFMEVLGGGEKKLDDLNKSNRTLLAALNANKKVQLELANAIFSDRETEFKKDFIEFCKKAYSADAESHDFNKAETVQAINKWCKDKTHGKIQQILNKLNPLEKMVLVNAVYFKGSWQEPFDKSISHDDHFNTAKGEKKPVKMMQQQEQHLFYRGDRFKSLGLAYNGGKQRMYIFLPDKGVELAAFLAQLNEKNWQLWKKAYSLKEVNLSLPRLKLESSTLLDNSLKKMGMPLAFDREKADFSRMIEQRTWISRVLQKCHMDINEEGTEAAAVTAVLMATESMRAPAPAEQFRVDRPFVLAIVDEKSQSFLFLAAVQSP